MHPQSPYDQPDTALENNNTDRQGQSPPQTLTATSIQAWMVSRLAEALSVNPDAIDIRLPFTSFGLDSLLAFTLTGDLADWLERDLPATLFWDYPTLETLAQYLAEPCDDTAAAADPYDQKTYLSAEREGPSYNVTDPPVVNRNAVPLSFAQQRLWFLDQLEPNSPFYNVIQAVRLSGPLDEAALRQTLDTIVARHQGLRTTIEAVDGRPVQAIAEQRSAELTVIDLSTWSTTERETEAQRLLTQTARRPFNLSHDVMLRALLLRLDRQEHMLLLVMHHVASDGWSIGVLFREFTVLYDAFCAGRPSPLPQLPIQYADYAIQQRQWLRGEVLEAQLAYWKKQLHGAPALLELPTDRPRPAIQTFRGTRQALVLPKSLSESITALARQESVTLFMTLMAAFKTLLWRYTGQEDILVGTPIAGRHRTESEALIGFFANTLVLRTDLSGNITFRQLLGRIRQSCLEAYAHQDLPFEKLVETLQPERALSRNPLFQVMFSMQNTPQQALALPGLTVSSLEVDSGTADFDLTLSMTDTEQGFAISVEYSTDLFDAVTMTRMLGHYQTLLEGAVADPEQHLSHLPLLSAPERQQLLVEWNNTHTDFPLLQQCVPQLFEAQVKRTPDAIAVVCVDMCLTYQELNQRANRLAALLVQQGVGPDVLVALLARRSMDFVTAILAVFKAGGAYLPLDPHHPSHRHRQILEQSRCSLVLVADEFVPAFSEMLRDLPAAAQPRILPIEQLLSQDSTDANLAPRCAPHHLAYVMYTSGSTGTPKGAMIEHVGMLNHLYVKSADLPLRGTDIVAQTASQCFDISVWQCLAALLVGGRVHIFDDEVALSPPELLEQVDRQGVTVLEVVPSVLRAMLEDVTHRGTDRPHLATLRWVICTGEALPPGLCNQWLHTYPAIPLMNAYGPTECSDDVTHYAMRQPLAEDASDTPIGRPVANMRMYVLDNARQPVPVGIPGELWIGGVGVGRGYLHDAEQTSRQFVPDPFVPEPGARLYKTGDLVRYVPDGNLVFLGRIDHQVKIRGFRIELEEVEKVLAQHPAVGETVVMAQDNGGLAHRASDEVLGTSYQAPAGEKRLVAYVVVNRERTLTISDMRRFLKQKLPEYMVPSALVLLDALPLTPNGKLDRSALPTPEPERPALNAGYVAPRTPIEALVAEIWAEVLRLERVGIEDDFFDLGGHSLLATQVISRVRTAFARELPLRRLFETPTVAGLTMAITNPVDQVGAETLSGLVTELEKLSEEEAKRVLTSEQRD